MGKIINEEQKKNTEVVEVNQEVRIFNRETIDAMNETLEIVAHPEKYKFYDNVDELFNDILKSDDREDDEI